MRGAAAVADLLANVALAGSAVAFGYQWGRRNTLKEWMQFCDELLRKARLAALRGDDQ